MANNKLQNQIDKIDELSRSLGVLKTRISALVDENASFDEIQQQLGKRLDLTRQEFLKSQLAADKLVQSVRKNKKATSEELELANKLEIAIGSVGAKYDSLSNKVYKTLNDAKREYIDLAKQERESDLKSVKESEIASSQRTKNANQALKDARDLATFENARKERLRKEEQARLRQEVKDLNEAERLKTQARKAAFTEKVKEAKADQALSEKLNKQNERLLKKLAKEQEAAAEKSKFFGKAFRDAFSPQAIGKALASIIKFISIYEILGRAISAVTDFLKDSIKAFIDYDRNISRVAAVSAANGEELASLSQSIRAVALETRFTANQVGELAVALAKLGVKAKEIPSLLRPISIAAQATGEDLTSVGESIFKVSNQFGLYAGQAAETSAILTAAVNKSSLSLDTFNTAIGYVGPSASQAGLSFEQTATALGILSDAGFSASRAGTGLRGVLTKLKKPGVDLIDTLQELADKNIGLEEATKLVGKTSQAQLIILLRNLDVLRETTLAEEGYAEQLKATSFQMSSFSGQLDLLSAAYEDLKIRAGEFLVSNEIVLELIGALSSKTETLARGYVLLRKESERLGDTFEARVAKGLREGATAAEILNNILEDSDDENIKAIAKSVSGLDSRFVDKLSTSFENLSTVLNGIGLQGLANDILRLVPNEEARRAIRGATGELEKLVLDEKRTKEVQRGYDAVNEKYAESVVAIGNLTDAEQKRQAAIKRSGTIQATINNLEARRLELQEENAEYFKYNIAFIEGEIRAWKELKTSLSDYTNKKKEALTKDPTDKYVSLYNQEKQALELRLKAIDQRQDVETRAYNQKVREINEIFALQNTQDLSDKEKTDLQIERSKALTQAAQEHKEALFEISEGIGQWDKDAEDFFNKYAALFKGSEKNTQRLENDNERFRQSLERLSEQTLKLANDANISGTEYANQFLNAGAEIIDQFTDNLGVLESQYSKTAYGQYQLSLAQRAYVEELKGNLDKLKEYYDSVKDQLGPEEKKRIETALAALSAIYNKAVGNIISDAEQKKLKGQFEELGSGFGKQIILGIDLTLGEGFQMVLDTTLKALSKFNDTALENTKNRLEAEKAAISNSYETEDEILQAKLENQLITEAEYRAQVEKNRKAQLAKENAIDKKIFDAEQKRDRQNALTDYLAALGSIIPNLISKGEGEPITISLKYALSAALATAAYSAEAKAINQRQFYPTRFAEGGLVYGPSHDEGGVPFTVRGQSGYEMEGGEYIVNRKSTQRYKSLLDQINNYGKSNYKYAAGGVVKDPTEVATKQIELLEAIASSNISLVGKLDKPVRSFVASSDLRSDNNALRIKERNSQL